MANIQMENLELRIKVKQLEFENQELRKELEKLMDIYNPSPVMDVASLFRELEQKFDTEETIEIENDMGFYKPLSGHSKGRDREILISLSINNGLNRDDIAKLFFSHTAKPWTAANNVMLRLIRSGHVRVDKKTSPYTYYSKYQIKKPSFEGYVYIIKEYHSNTYKIGKAKNIENRLRMFNVKLPFKWELIHTIKTDDYTLTEKLIQDVFIHNRIKGTEWFDLTNEDVTKIKNNEFNEEIKKHILIGA